MVRLGALAAAGAALLSIPLAHGSCDGVLPDGASSSKMRAITGRDLAELRDIGEPGAYLDDTTPLALSPDGLALAFVISRGDTDANRICRALVLLDTRSGKARVLDAGGELPIAGYVYRGMWVKTGYPEVVTPVWSPDGKWIAWRKRMAGVTQVWRVRPDGSDSQQVTDGDVDIESVAWTADSATLVLTWRPSTAAGERAVDQERRSGWLYDERVTPNERWRPNLWAKDVPLETAALDLAHGVVRGARAEEAAIIAAPSANPYLRAVASAFGYKAWTETLGSHPLASTRLWAADPAGARVACPASACDGRIGNLWWDADKPILVFQRREGWHNETTALYRWDLATRRVTPILRTRDAITGCVRSGPRLICGRENAVTPRRLVELDMIRGTQRMLFDPNPEFRSIALGRVERLRWKNDFGLPAWGDLVLPPGYDGREKLPLVIVTYLSRGFLRGGIGDDYPIHLLAAQGMAVLSLERPPHIAKSFPEVKSWDEVNGVGRRDWGERRNVLSATLHGIDAAVATGSIDARKIGITGLSDGASNVEFALINTRRFAAAAMSTCCDGPVTNLVMGGPAWGDWNHKVMGYPLSVDADRSFWKPMSLAVNARQVDTPLLLQLADRESLLALESYGALREAGKPAEMHVFDDEYHNKVQPAHRLAVYTRGVDWFRFWLQGLEDPAPGKSEQYRRWHALRAAKARKATP